ncbi:Sensor histidine kinase RcsC [Paraburkholderia kirstenboschensis]|uniref:response regulator n=1 Tax=Paraburkholderia kirstenboschensis TaxID=1245436 RepID=UPI000ABD7F19|nr:response regulator [Paraburkholderia kirstenboschensis]CAD6560561.1 Sensor histidine kinase RcsC [Paraburkholderia kirstenboschensis]
MKSGIWTDRKASLNRPLRVLVVDDYAVGAEAVALALTIAGHEARFAFDADSAFQCIASWTPDIAVLDINMPSPDGFQLAAILRAADGTGETVLIAFTSLDEEAVQPPGLAAGFDAFCRKGAGTGPLLDIIARLALS